QNGGWCAEGGERGAMDAAWHGIGGGDATTVAGAMNRPTSPSACGSFKQSGALFGLAPYPTPKLNGFSVRAGG
ncbi:MAG: hypothetical protein IJS87_08535, partial [Rhodocyclaceae bacterium]|nr:hypothetical protein [Rhodocyclaceae bacterium]